MKDQHREDIIRAYLAGEDSPEGEALFHAWYASFRDEPTQPLPEAEKERLRQKMFRAVEKQRKRRSRALVYRVAAGLVGFLFVALTGAWYYYTHRLLEINTTNAELRELVLPDGSQVTLNANSSLKYLAGWEDEDVREVWLVGEAFFSVTRAPHDQKFIVHTPHLDVRVLGTKFNVRSRREQSSVVLAEGAVEAYVPAALERVLMKPGERVQYHVQRSAIVRTPVNPLQYTAWKEQQLLLNNTSLREIAAALEDYYGYGVVLADDQLGELRLSSTSTLSLEEPEVLLAAVAEIFSLKITRKQRTIYLEAR